MELIEKLQKIIEREIDNVPMVLTDPLTLRRLRAERLAQAATAVIQAYGDARADAARREALEEASKVARDYASKAAQRGWVLKPGSIVTAARHIATTIRALKGNPNG